MNDNNLSGGPVTAHERIASLDVLRGFALLGILLVNVAFFAHPVTDPFSHGGELGGADTVVAWLTGFFAQGKFYPLFSLLFGLGFAVQLERTRASGRPFVPAYLRRLLVLLAIGILHGVFIWAGDILTVYALLGFLLLLLGLGRPRWLLICAIIAYGLQLLMVGGMGFSLQTMASCSPVINAQSADETATMDPALVAACKSEGMQHMAAGFDQAQAEMTTVRDDAWAAYTGGSFAEVTDARASEFGVMLSNMGFFGLQVLAMFLFGAWLGKRGFFAAPNEHRKFFRNLVIVAVVAGLPLSAWFANVNLAVDYNNLFDPKIGWSFLINLFAGPLLALGYAGAIVLGMQTRAARWLGVLAPVGRMALTNYLAQSVICTLVFYSYGFGLMAERPGPFALLGVVGAVFVLEVLWSRWWLKRFAFGPMEYLWRTLTYFKLPRMRSASANA